jgi:hypothetical protein
MDDPGLDEWMDPLLEGFLSQEANLVDLNPIGGDIAEEPAVVDALQGTNEVLENQRENTVDIENTVDDTAGRADNDNEEAQKPKAKRNYVSYANKKLLASMDLFLDPLYKDQFDDPSVLLVGQVKECPREVNGKRYRIEWKNEGKPLPSGLDIKWWLQSFIPASKENRAALQCAITKYANCPIGKAAKKKKAVTTTRNPKPTKTPGVTIAGTEEALASPPRQQVVDDV